MKNKKTAIYLSLALIVLLVIFKVGYDYISKNYPDALLNTDITRKDTTSDLKPAPDFTAYTLDGKAVKLSDYKGVKPVVINFWTSWCPNCIFEMPEFQEAYEKYGSDKVEILMVNITDGDRETVETAEHFIEDGHFTMPILLDTDLSATNAFNIQAIPRTVFINKDGNITSDRTGVITHDALNSSIEDLIK